MVGIIPLAAARLRLTLDQDLVAETAGADSLIIKKQPVKPSCFFAD